MGIILWLMKAKVYYLAVWSFILSILGVLAAFPFVFWPFIRFLSYLFGKDFEFEAVVCTSCFGQLLLLVAPVLGIISLVKIKKSKGVLKGKGFAIARIVISLSVLIWPFVMLANMALHPW